MSVVDLVGKFEFVSLCIAYKNCTETIQKDSGGNLVPRPIHRAATTPSTHLRSVYRSTLPKAGPSKERRPPRRRLVSSETIQEENGPFTPKQVSAATSFTNPRARVQPTVPKLSRASAVEAPPLRKDTGVQASCDYHDKATQSKSDNQDQSAQPECSYEQNSAQAIPAFQDQAIQVGVKYKDSYTQSVVPYTDNTAQTASIKESWKLRPGQIQQEPPGATGKRSFHDQASQTDCHKVPIERIPAPVESNVPGFFHTGKSEEVLKQAVSPRDIIRAANPASHSSTDVAFYTARDCSTVDQTRRNSLLDIGASVEPNTITITFPRGIKVHMLQRVRGGKIILDPGALPRATSSEALAQGEVYTPGYVREEQSIPADRCSRSASCSPCSSPSSCSSLAGTTTSKLRADVTAASVTVKDSRHIEANQDPSLQPNDSADEADSQQKSAINTQSLSRAGAVACSASSLPELSDTVASITPTDRRADVNGKRRASSVSYWFESREEDPIGAGSDIVTRPQTLAQFRSVPLIRVQRPSTDTDMGFGLGTRAVKHLRSESPHPSAREAPALPAGDAALHVAELPTGSKGHRKHIHEHLTDRMSKQAVPVEPPIGGKTGVRARVKRKGGNVGRKGRKKIIFRKKVLRLLLGKDLAETVSQTLNTTENVAPVAAPSAQPPDIVSSAAAPTSAVPETPLPEPALPEPPLPVGVTPLASAQLGGADLAAKPKSAIPAVDGLHERKAEHAAKKEIKRRQGEEKRKDMYEQAKTNLEALTSTPCVECGGQRAYILNFAYENKKKILEYEQPEMKRRHRRKAVRNYVERVECRCPRGTGTAGWGSPEAVLKAKEMYGCHISSFILAKS